MNLNKAMILGNLTRDPELRQTPGGQSVCSFSIATNRTFKNKAGEQQKEVEYHNIVAWGKTGELIAQYMKKGSQLLVEGRLQTRSWEAKTGGKQYRTEIVVESMQFGAKPQGGGARDEYDQSPPADRGEEIQAEDLPF